MASTQVLPTDSVLAYHNYAFDSGIAVIDVSSETLFFPAKNVLDPRVGRTWRTSSNTNASSEYVSIDLGTSITLKMLAILGSNLLSGSSVILTGSTKKDFTSPFQTWTYAAYAQSAAKVVRFYIGKDDASAVQSQVYRYWRVKITTRIGTALQINDTFLEIGSLWFDGGFVTLSTALGVQIKEVDNSVTDISAGGMKLITQNRIYHEIDLTFPFVDETTLYGTLKNELNARAAASYFIYDLYAPSTNATKKANGCYFCNIAKADFEIGLHWIATGDLRLTLAEVQG